MCNISAKLNAVRGINSAIECVRLDFVLQGAAMETGDRNGIDMQKVQNLDGRSLVKAAILGFLGGYAACHDPGCLLRTAFETIAGDVEHEFNEAAQTSNR